MNTPSRLGPSLAPSSTSVIRSNVLPFPLADVFWGVSTNGVSNSEGVFVLIGTGVRVAGRVGGPGRL